VSAIVGLRIEARYAGADPVEHLVGLGQVDVEQFRVELRSLRLEQANRFVRRCRRRRRRTSLGDRLDRLLQFGRVPRSSSCEQPQCCVGVGLQRRIADQFAVVLECGEFRGKALAHARLARRALECGERRGQGGLQIGDRGLDRVALVLAWLRGLAETPGEQRIDQALAVRSLLLDRLDVEAQPGQSLGESLEVLVDDRRLRVRVFVDPLLTQRKQLLSVIETQDLQRAGDLLAVARESGQIGALVVIAEEGVEHLLHVPQVGLDLARHLREEQPFLRAARHLVEHRRGDIGCGTILLGGVEARDHRIDLAGNSAGLPEEFSSTDSARRAGRVFHRHRLGSSLRQRIRRPAAPGEFRRNRARDA
jgi:hypothetical protein